MNGNKVSVDEIRTFIKFTMRFFEEQSHTTLLQAAAEACHPRNLEEAKAFFCSYNQCGEDLESIDLERCAYAAGWHAEQASPTHTFAEISEVLTHYRAGMLTEAEMLQTVQLVPTQREALATYISLPFKVQAQTALALFDEEIDVKVARLTLV